MNKLTTFLLSLFSPVEQPVIEPTTPHISRRYNPKTKAIRLIVESVIGKDYQTMYSDKLKNGRKVKFYNIFQPVTEAQLTKINDKLSELDVTAVINNKHSIVVKYWSDVCLAK
jgi:hypothetical protein